MSGVRWSRARSGPFSSPLLSLSCCSIAGMPGVAKIRSSDVPGAVFSKSTSVGGVAQQLARGFGIAIGAALLALIAGPRMLTVDDFRVAFFLIALLPLLSALGFLRLSPIDGAEVSGHHRNQPRSA